MAYCINCDKLMSDNPEWNPKGFCDEVCQQEYVNGADAERIKLANSQDANTPQIQKTIDTERKHTTAPDVKTFADGLANVSNQPK